MRDDILRPVLIVLGIALYSLCLNLFRFFRCKHFLGEYYKWLQGTELNLVESQSEVIELFKKAGIRDALVPHAAPMGYGQVLTGTVGVFVNFPSNRQDAAQIIINMFHRAIGIYRRRIWQSVNPFSWIEFIIYLPQNTLLFLGVSGPNLLTKIFQLIYWFVAVIFALAAAFYATESRAFLDRIFKLIGG